MFEEYKNAVSHLNLKETLESYDDNSNSVPEELALMRYCVAMYNQEYMVKVRKMKTYLKICLIMYV